MRWVLRIFIFLCFALPVISISYKTQVLELDFLPPASTDLWNIQVEGKSDDGRLSLPYPSTTRSQTVHHMRLEAYEAGADEVRSDAGTYLAWNLREPAPVWGRVDSQIQPFQMTYPRPLVDAPLSIPLRLRYYLEMPALSSAEINLLESLEDALFFEDDSPLERVRKSYLYITEEVTLSPSVDTFAESLELQEGSSFQQARLMQILARRAGVPSRITLGIHLSAKPQKGRNKFRISFANEVWTQSGWFPMDVTRRKYGSASEHQIVLHRDFDSLQMTPEGVRRSLTVYAEPVRTSSFDSGEYSSSLRSKSSWLANMSLFDLPLSIQSALSIVLLIPLGAVLLSFSRNMIGVATFGIFTPVLLTLFFIETSLSFGILFFGLVITLGFFQRYILDRFYLLAVPRLSILLTLVVMSFVGFIMVNEQYAFMGVSPSRLNYFPIVIVTVFIERFSVYFVEEGTWNTLKSLFGTFFVALLCYLLFSFENLRVAMITHPELLLMAIGLNILIGSYKGYRLSEIFRFRDFRKSSHV